MDRKLQVAHQLKAADDGHGSFSGYASTWDNWDSVKERPARGAFKATLTDFIGDGFIALHHAWERLPIATVKDAFEDDHGLFITADFHSTDEAQKARTVLNERLARGKSAKLSIGYEVLRDTYVNDPPGGRVLEEIKLYEVSLVTVPANDRASVISAKGVPPAGMPLADHHDAALAAVQGLTERYGELKDLRAKEGRVLSESNRTRIQSLVEALAAVHEELTGLLAATEPPPAKADPATVRALFLDFQRIQAHLNGAL